MSKANSKDPNRLDDGFGNIWYKCNLNENCGLHIVRPASLNAGATLSKDCTMNLILSVLVGLAMAGTSGMIIETFVMDHIQVKKPQSANFLNI